MDKQQRAGMLCAQLTEKTSAEDSAEKRRRGTEEGASERAEADEELWVKKRRKFSLRNEQRTRKIGKSCIHSAAERFVGRKSAKEQPRRVVFAPTCKAHDGLQASHQLMDFFAWKFFSQPTHPQSPLELFHDAWRKGQAAELSSVHALMVDLERRICEADASEDVPVLPGGGGRLIQLNASHLGLVRLLTEMISASVDMAKNIQLHGGTEALDATLAPEPACRRWRSVRYFDQESDMSSFLKNSGSGVSGTHSKRIFSLPVVYDKDDEGEEDDRETWSIDGSEDNLPPSNRTVVVDGVPLSAKDIQRMEERLAQIEDEYDGGEISGSEYEIAKKHLTCVLDAVRCAAS